MTTRDNSLSCIFRKCPRSRLQSITAALYILLSPTAHAETSCAIDSVTAVNFGTYDVFSPLANNNGIGSISIRCQGGGPTFLVTLSKGQSNSYASRIMNSGGNSLNYNLYTSAARIVVWGDGTGGSSAMAANRNSTTTLSVFGQIPAGQDAAVGIYTDSITTLINF
jgi:spore coat protein U-like protein